MTWQDELRELDEELAAGRLSAEDYRRQRDDLLAQSASTAGPGTPPKGQPIQQAGQQPGQPAHAGQPAEPAAGPFPPPFRWDQTPSESTQVMSPIRDEPGSGSDTTQVVRGGDGADAERTQVVAGRPRPPAGPPPVHPMPPVQSPPSWQLGGDQAPPWSGADLPPTTDTTPAWFKQGPEVFESSGSGRGRTIAIAAAALAVVLIAGAVVFFVVRNYQNTRDPVVAQTTTTAPPATTTSAAPQRLLGDLVGEVDKNATGPTTLDAASGKQFSPEEAEFMATCGADDGEAQVLYRGFWFTQVHVFACTDSAKADAATEQLFTLQKRYGFGPRDEVNGLRAVQLDDATDVPDVPFVGRIFYVSGKNLLRVEVRGKTPQDVEQGLDEVSKALADRYPAS